MAIFDDHEILLDSLSSWVEMSASDFELVLRASIWLQLVHIDNFPADLVFLNFLSKTLSMCARSRMPLVDSDSRHPLQRKCRPLPAGRHNSKMHLQLVSEKYAEVNRPASKRAEFIRRAAEDAERARSGEYGVPVSSPCCTNHDSYRGPGRRSTSHSDSRGVPVLACGIRIDFPLVAFPRRRLLEIASAAAVAGRSPMLDTVGDQYVFDGDQVAIDGVDVPYESLCGALGAQQRLRPKARVQLR